MATIDDLTGSGILQLFQVPDDIPARLPVRPLWMTQHLADWIDGTLVYDQRRAAGRTAYEHLEQFFVDFRCNPTIHADDLRRMVPTSSGVWTMRPALLRVYGWVPRTHAIVAVCAEFEADTKSNRRLNDGCRDLVLDFIRCHEVSEVLYGDFLDAFPKTP